MQYIFRSLLALSCAFLPLFVPSVQAHHTDEPCCSQEVQAKAKEAVQDKDAVQDANVNRIVRATGYIPLTPERRAHFQKISHEKHGGRLKMMAANQTLPAAFDFRDKVPLPVWDQGNCGSCYLVSTVRTASSVLIAGGYGKADNSFMLSSQFGMDRPRNFGGCGGGNGTEVIDWMVRNGWLAEIYMDQQGVVHKDYPSYEARTANDRSKAGAKVWMKGADWGYVSSSNTPTTDEIKTALYNFGRLNVSLDAGGQFGGIGNGTITSLGNSINHEINMVAFDDNHNNGNGTKGAFLLENQWNTNWGNNGYAWVTYAAAKHIVDIFFVTASPLPPPPPPITIPSITSPLAASSVAGQPWFYLITASNSPNSFDASIVPIANTQLVVTKETGAISGTVNAAGTYQVTVSATNSSGTGTAVVILTVTDKPVPPPVGVVTIKLTPAQVQDVIIQSKVKLLTPADAAKIEAHDKIRAILDSMNKTKEQPKTKEETKKTTKVFPSFTDVLPEINSGRGLPLIAFAGREPIDIPGATVATLTGIFRPGGVIQREGILISVNGRTQQILPVTATEAEIRRQAGL